MDIFKKKIDYKLNFFNLKENMGLGGITIIKTTYFPKGLFVVIPYSLFFDN